MSDTEEENVEIVIPMVNGDQFTKNYDSNAKIKELIKDFEVQKKAILKTNHINEKTGKEYTLDPNMTIGEMAKKDNLKFTYTMIAQEKNKEQKEVKNKIQEITYSYKDSGHTKNIAEKTSSIYKTKDNSKLQHKKAENANKIPANLINELTPNKPTMLPTTIPQYIKPTFPTNIPPHQQNINMPFRKSNEFQTQLPAELPVDLGKDLSILGANIVQLPKLHEFQINPQPKIINPVQISPVQPVAYHLPAKQEQVNLSPVKGQFKNIQNIQNLQGFAHMNEIFPETLCSEELNNLTNINIIPDALIHQHNPPSSPNLFQNFEANLLPMEIPYQIKNTPPAFQCITRAKTFQTVPVMNIDYPNIHPNFYADMNKINIQPSIENNFNNQISNEIAMLNNIQSSNFPYNADLSLNDLNDGLPSSFSSPDLLFHHNELNLDLNLSPSSPSKDLFFGDNANSSSYSKTKEFATINDLINDNITSNAIVSGLNFDVGLGNNNINDLNTGFDDYGFNISPVTDLSFAGFPNELNLGMTGFNEQINFGGFGSDAPYDLLRF